VYTNDAENPDNLEAIEQTDHRYPTAEESMLRLALERTLSPKQKKMWEMWNFDKLTQPEIAKKLRMSQQAVSQQIKTIEKQAQKWIMSHQQLYGILKDAEAQRNKSE